MQEGEYLPPKKGKETLERFRIEGRPPRKRWQNISPELPEGSSGKSRFFQEKQQGTTGNRNFREIMRRIITICLLAAMVAIAFPMPEAKAIDPVTMAILAPVAIKAAEKAAPYLYRGVYNSGKCLLQMGKDTAQILYLPYGLGYMCVGGMKHGLVYVIKGGIAPAKLVVHTLLLPLMLLGVNINI